MIEFQCLEMVPEMEQFFAIFQLQGKFLWGLNTATQTSGSTQKPSSLVATPGVWFRKGNVLNFISSFIASHLLSELSCCMCIKSHLSTTAVSQMLVGSS